MNVILQLLVLLSPIWGPFVLVWVVKGLDNDPWVALRLFIERLEGRVIIVVLTLMVALPVGSVVGRRSAAWS